MSVKNISIIIVIIVFVVLIVYNLIPYLIYLIKKYCLPKRKIAKQLEPNSVSSPWIRISSRTERDSVLDESSTVSELFSKTAKKFSDKQCFGCRQVLTEVEEKQFDGKIFKKVVLSDYKWFSYGEIDQRVDLISKGLLFIGVKPKHIVMIYAETRIEWHITCQSLLRIGATVATLYTTLGEDGIIHGINETEVTHLVTNFELLNKLKPILNKLPKLESIVYMRAHNKQNIDKIFGAEEHKNLRLYSLTQIEELGKTHNQLKGIDPKEEDIAVLMYTSGSTGVPKGVMITHKNFLSAIRGFYAFAHHLKRDDIYCAYLPLAHIMEMSAELFFIANGLPVGYGSTQTLTDKSTAIKKGTAGDAPLLRPTIMACVPLVLDRIRSAVTEEIAKRNAFSRNLVKVLYSLKIFWFRRGFDCPLINYIFCRKFRAILGGRIRIIPIGGAPLSPQTHDFIRGFFNIHILQGYGLTETSASATLMDADDKSVGFVGQPLEGVHIKLIDWDEGNYRLTDKPNPRGEVVIGGNCVTKGYFKNEKATQEYYREESGIKWFLTGDIGEIHSNGSLKIIDRKKDIIKLSTGEYISLAKVEGELKKNPFVSNICIYGKSENDYLIAFILPNHKQLESLAQNLSKNKMNSKELCNDSDINQKVLESIRETAQTAKLPKVEIPTKIKLCSEEWLPENGLVTAAFKLRRKNIQEFYQKDINYMYGSQQSS